MRVAQLVAQLLVQLLLSLPVSSSASPPARRSSTCSFDETVDEIVAQLPPATGTSNASIQDELIRAYSQPDRESINRWQKLGLVTHDNTAPPRSLTASQLSLLSPRGVLAQLQWIQFLLPRAHAECHLLGQAAFHEAGGQLDGAMRICEYRCTGGCFHGVVNAFITNHSTTRDSTDMALRHRLDELIQNPPVRRWASLGEVAHGIGHGLVLSGREWPEALRFCSTVLPRGSKTPLSLAHYCAGGVIMQSNHDGVGPVHRTSPAATVRQCSSREVPLTSRAACMYYGLRSSWPILCKHCASQGSAGSQMASGHKADGLLTEVGKEEGTWQRIYDLSDILLTFCIGLGGNGGVANLVSMRSCVYGLASSTGYHSRNRLEGVQLCRNPLVRFETPLRIACIDGLVFRAAKFWGSAQIEAICGAMDDVESEAKLCRAIAYSGMYSMGKEPIFQRILPVEK